MKNFNMTAKSAARVLGTVLVLTDLVFANPWDTLQITVKFLGDVGTNSFTVTATPQKACPTCEMPTGGGTKTFVSNSANSVSFTNCSGGWTGKVSITPSTGNYGFLITPKDTSFRGLETHATFIVNVTDTSKPVVKLSPLSGTTINVNEPFTFYDSIKDNTFEVKSIQHSYSIDSGKTWDSIPGLPYQEGYFPIMNYSQTFTPAVASDNFMLRAIVTDRFALADTDIVTLKVKDQVNIRSEKKPVSLKVGGKNMTSYDLLGRIQITQPRGMRQISKYIISYRGQILINN
jgi:hypothetical protein